jgi:hypothetical protein
MGIHAAPLQKIAAALRVDLRDFCAAGAPGDTVAALWAILASGGEPFLVPAKPISLHTWL